MRANNYFDGPFDQLPDNFIEGEALRDAILAVRPQLKGEIDRFGASPDGSIRFNIGPYLPYREVRDLYPDRRLRGKETKAAGLLPLLRRGRRIRWYGAAEARSKSGRATVNTMNWDDDGIVLGVRRHGEANAIVEVMTRAHGRHLGLVRGGAGSRMRPVLQPGNTVRVTWRARLDEHLGHYTVEGLRLRASELMIAAHAAYGVTHLAALCRLLPERDPHEEVHDTLDAILDHLEDRAVAAVLIARFELQMLTELGFGLDLDAVRRDRRDRGPDLRLAEVGPRGVADRGRAVA